MAVETATAIEMTPTAEGVRYGELDSPLSVLFTPKRKNRWQAAVTLDDALVGGTVLDPADATQRKKLIADCGLTDDLATEAKRVLLYAGQCLADDTDAWKRWQFEALCRKFEAAEQATKAAAAAQREQRAEAAWSQGRGLLTDPGLLYNVGPMLKKLGLAGEELLGRVLYLVITSRNTPEPMNITIRGGSSAGKSFTLKQVMRLHPEEAFWTLTAMSAKALVYTEEQFAHRYVVLFEQHGGEESDYLIRTLQSEGRIEYEVTEKDEHGRLATRHISKEGPTGFITTTTQGLVHPENDTRLWMLDADESEEQTGLVNAATAHRFNSRGPEPALEEWQAAQVWLSLAGATEAEIPYSDWLAKRMPKRPLRIRRDFGRLLVFISTSALLFQAQRQRAGDGRVIATVGDYATAYALAAAIFTDTLRAVPERTRAILERLEALYLAKASAVADGQEPYITHRELAADMGKDRSYISRHLQKALEAELVVNLEAKDGKLARLQPRPAGLMDTAPVLPDPDELAAAFPSLGGIWVHPLTGETKDFPPIPPAQVAQVTQPRRHQRKRPVQPMQTALTHPRQTRRHRCKRMRHLCYLCRPTCTAPTRENRRPVQLCKGG
jgi:hypothetical protein